MTWGLVLGECDVIGFTRAWDELDAGIGLEFRQSGADEIGVASVCNCHSVKAHYF